jgi:hypothetical protein
MVLPAGISPATWRFEAARSDKLSYGSIRNAEFGIGVRNSTRESKLTLGAHSAFRTHYSALEDGADGETRTLVGRFARQFTKLLLSLLSHVGLQNAERRTQKAEWERVAGVFGPPSFFTLHS